MTLKKPLGIFLAFCLFTGSAFGAAFQFGGLRLDKLTVTSSSSTVVLTKAHKQVNISQGSSNQVYNLPDATTLQAGYWYEFINESTGTLTINNSSSTIITTLPGTTDPNNPFSATLYVNSSATTGGPWSTASTNIGLGRKINSQTGTTYTFVLSDGLKSGNNTIVLGSNASAQTFTVPPHSSVAYAAGDEIDVCQMGAGKLTLAQGSGVTISSKSSNKAIGAQYVCVSLVQTATQDTWLLIGDLIAQVLEMLGFKFYV